MKNIITKMMIIVAFAMMLLGVSSCYTERTAQRQVSKAHNKYPEVSARLCADVYAPKDSVSLVREYIQGEDVVFLDTVTETQMFSDTVALVKYVTKTVLTTDTLRDTKYVQLENKAKIELKDVEIKRLNHINTALEQMNELLRCWLWILGGVVAAYLVYMLVRIYLRKMLFV
ncbi:MAG TPA: hypothetical protein VEB40_00575 [Flavipsychrobacter sp.]|nr:hypothetical protein [Flavipsychrobacter sp.]